MNLLHKSVVAAAAVLGLSGTAQAVIINGADAGDIDTLVGQTSQLNSANGGAGGDCSENASNPEDESCWASNVLGFEVSLVESTSKQSYVQSTSDPGIYGFAFPAGSTPGYYLLKNAQWWGLFDNRDSLAYAVFDPSGFVGQVKIPSGDLTISHVRVGPNENGGGGGGGTPIPLPGTVALLGLGLLAAGFARSRKT